MSSEVFVNAVHDLLGQHCFEQIFGRLEAHHLHDALLIAPTGQEHDRDISSFWRYRMKIVNTNMLYTKKKICVILFDCNESYTGRASWTIRTDQEGVKRT